MDAGIINRPLGVGIAPDVTLVDDLCYVAYGARPDALVLVVLTLDGVEVKRVTLPHGFDQSFPRFDGSWLVYRQDEAHGFQATAWNVQTGQSWLYSAAGGTFGLTVHADFGLCAYEWRTGIAPWRIRFGSLVNGQMMDAGLDGAPDGLDAILSLERVTLRKDTRGDVPGLWYPSRAGHLTVGELRDAPGRPNGGIGVQLDGELLRVALPAQNTPNPRCAVAGGAHALVCWGQTVRLLLASEADLRALPPVERVPGPVVHLPPKSVPAPKPVPAPSPAPITKPVVHEGDLLMFSLFTDPSKHLLAVKSVKFVSDGGTVLENTDGRIVSIQPDGSVQDRNPGADGGYERCKVSGNVATFKPADKYFTFAFVVVDGL